MAGLVVIVAGLVVMVAGLVVIVTGLGVLHSALLVMVAGEQSGRISSKINQITLCDNSPNSDGAAVQICSLNKSCWDSTSLPQIHGCKLSLFIR